MNRAEREELHRHLLVVAANLRKQAEEIEWYVARARIRANMEEPKEKTNEPT